MHPRVANETGQLLGVNVAYSSTICMLIYGQVRVDYSMVCNFMTVVGTILGMKLQFYIIEKSGGKHKYTVLLMAFAILVILVSSSSLTLSIIM